MKKWNLIQNQIFKEPPINSLRKENYGKGHACQSQSIKDVDVQPVTP